nr:hypothetical protein [Ceratocystis fimbriata]
MERKAWAVTSKIETNLITDLYFLLLNCIIFSFYYSSPCYISYTHRRSLVTSQFNESLKTSSILNQLSTEFIEWFRGFTYINNIKNFFLLSFKHWNFLAFHKAYMLYTSL